MNVISPATEAPVNPAVEEVEAEDPGTRIARLVLEDYVITSLLRHGRPLRGSELVAGADFSLSRQGLRAGLQDSKVIKSHGREWEISLRADRRAWSREEKSRQPLETTLSDLMHFVGKPLGLPIMLRELAELRAVIPASFKASLEVLVRDSRFAVPVSDTTWLHSDFIFDPGAERADVVRRENQIEKDADWIDLQDMPLPDPQGDLRQRALDILEAIGQPISRRLLGYMLWNQTPGEVSREALIATFADRETFAALRGGYITLQEQVPQWKSLVEEWLSGMGAGEEEVDEIGLLRQRLAPAQVIAPSAHDLLEVSKFARSAGSAPISVGAALVHALEMETDDKQFTGALQGLNDALRRDTNFLPLGIGRFILRDAVPDGVGQVPETLRPVHLELRNTENNEPLDMELTDEGLEGDAVDFIHAPHWEDVAEEIEVRLPRRSEIPGEIRYTLLHHHQTAGTMKLRRADEEFFGIESSLTRLAILAEDNDGRTELGGWASRDSSLIHGLGEWLKDKVPASGAQLIFAHEGATGFKLKLAEPCKLTHITPAREAELLALREASAYLSLYEILQKIMLGNEQGYELPGLWAEVNVVRRTSKRLLASVLCAYNCFYFKQRGPRQQFWRYDEAKLDQGFKRNKRKFVRK